MTTKQEYSSSKLAMNNNHIKDVENKTSQSLIKSEADEPGANIEDEGPAEKRNVYCYNVAKSSVKAYCSKRFETGINSSYCCKSFMFPSK